MEEKIKILEKEKNDMDKKGLELIKQLEKEKKEFYNVSEQKLLILKEKDKV